MSYPSARMCAGGGNKNNSVRRIKPSTLPQQPSTSTAPAQPPPAAEDEEWSAAGASHPSFACDDRAISEMRLAVGAILEQTGFTHAASSALELLTDIGIRYMRKLATTATNATEMDGRTRTTDADVLAGFRTMRVSIDEMNEYMRQVRPIPEPRVIPAFPLPIAPTPIVHTPVPPALVIAPPEAIRFPGLPPMSSAWLSRDELATIIAEKEKENSEKDERRDERAVGQEEVKRMLSSFTGVPDGVPCFFTKSATAFGLRKGDKKEAAKRGVTGPLRVEVGGGEEDEKRRRGEKRRAMESKSGRVSKQARGGGSGLPSAGSTASFQDEPGTSASFAAAAASHYNNNSQASSRAHSRAHTPAIAAGVPTGPISALRDATRPLSVVPSLVNIPPAGALPPDYANSYTEGAPLRVPGLLAAFGRDGSESREGEQARPSPAAPAPARPPSPLLSYDSLVRNPETPQDAPPEKLVRLSILKNLFSREHVGDLKDEVAKTMAGLKATASTTTPATKPPSRPSSRPSSSLGSRYAKAKAAAQRKSAPIAPPPPREPTTFTPRLKIKPPKKPPTPVVEEEPAPSPSPAPSPAPPPLPMTSMTTTPLAPLRLKINIGARPSTGPPTPVTLAARPPPAPVPPPPPVDLSAPEAYDAAVAAPVDEVCASTSGPSSQASTIPAFFSPATAAAIEEAAVEGAVLMEDGEGKEREEDGEEEGKKKKKKHKKEKKEKKEKKHKKHKKSSKRELEEDEDEEGLEGGSRSISRAEDTVDTGEGTVDNSPAAPPELPPTPSGGLKLKIRLGPRPTE